ncbi:pseudouridine synthase [Aestuariivirga sp.]|uniref:pseudouridine synthase n=1 Tax=Aestuariivirga sp. TaxID=2650926 RepID=UPI003BABAC2A
MHIPTRHGVGPSCVTLPAGPWPTVLDFLVERMPNISREAWTARLRSQSVLNAEGQPVLLTQPYTPHMRVFYYRHIEDEPQLPEQARILFEDDHLLVSDKPHFMPVTAAGQYVQQSLHVQLRNLTGCDDLVPLHRIDRETAGLVLLSKRPANRDAYHALFRQQLIHKTYHAIAPFRAELTWPRTHTSRLVAGEPFFRMQEVPGDANSETRISLLRTDGSRALYQLEPVSGKRHQLRVHMLSLGLALEGDLLYPELLRTPDAPEDFSQVLQLLAQRIAFTDPVTGAGRVFESQRSLHF